MSEQEKELKRIVDLLESHLGDSDNYLPEEPMTPSEFEEEYPVEAAMQIAVKLMLDARIAPTQGADARPVAIYQSRLHTDEEGTWSDGYEATFYACKAYPDKYETRIVYATRDAAPSDGPVIGYVNTKWAEHRKGTTTIYPESHPRLATFPVFAASAPMEET